MSSENVEDQEKLLNVSRSQEEILSRLHTLKVIAELNDVNFGTPAQPEYSRRYYDALARIRAMEWIFGIGEDPFK